jgi:endonuclease-3
MDPTAKPCMDELCRVQMLHQMKKAIDGTGLLLEMIQPEQDIHNKPVTESRKKNAFKTLVATVLSVRSKDETTFKVVENLWKYYNTPADFMNAPIERLEELIRSSGTYHNKAKALKEIGRILHEELQDQVPETKEGLLKLPGVGNKVAGCVLVLSFGIPAIPVDTHVHRISNRIGWVKTKDPDQTEKALEPLFPIGEWKIINYTLVSYGKKICKPTNPDCLHCVVSDRCQKNGITFIDGKPKVEKIATKSKKTSSN